MRRLKALRGVSLVEALVALTISAMLLVAGLPAFTDYLRNTRLREAGHALLADAQLAQSEAVKRNASVRLETTGSLVRISETTSSPALDRQQNLPESIVATSASITFDSRGRPAADAAIDLQLSGAACSASLRCPGLRLDAGGGIRLCGDLSSCN